MANKTWIGGIASIGYDNGTNEPAVGDVLTGAGGATGVLISLTQAGAWDGSAAGILTLRAISGTFVEDEVITNTTQSETMADIDIAGSAFADESGNFNIDNNWSPFGAPVNADDLFFNGLAEDVPEAWEGSTLQTSSKKFSVNDGLNQSAGNFASITVSNDYDGNIGYGLDSGTYHGLRCASDSVIFFGSGDFHLIAQHATEDIDTITCSGLGSMFLGKGSADGKSIVKLTNGGGTITILAAETGTLAAPELDQLTNVAANAETTIAEDNSSATLSIDMVSGTLTARCSINDITVSGGTFNIGSSDFVPAATRTISAIVQFGGTIIWDMAATISGLICYDGSLSLSGSGAKILGDAAVNGGTIEVYEARVNLSGGSPGVFTLAADSEVKQIGNGAFNPPKQVDVTW
jgi:hypothetical protein